MISLLAEDLLLQALGAHVTGLKPDGNNNNNNNTFPDFISGGSRLGATRSGLRRPGTS